MDKLYDRNTWNNDNRPAINKDSLNHIEKGIDDIDNRLVTVGNNTEKLNDSLDEQGLLDIKDTSIVQGYRSPSNGNITSDSKYVCETGLHPCKSGDVVTVKNGNATSSFIVGYNNGTFVHYYNFNGTWTVPSGVNQFAVSWQNDSGITPQTAGKISVYLNNQIEQIKADLTLNASDVLTVASGYTLQGATNLHKKNNRLYGYLEITGSIAIDNNGRCLNAFTFNNGYKPKTQAYCVGQINGGGYHPASFQIGTNGSSHVVSSLRSATVGAIYVYVDFELA